MSCSQAMVVFFLGIIATWLIEEALKEIRVYRRAKYQRGWRR